jgi:hypothetical protein
VRADLVLTRYCTFGTQACSSASTPSLRVSSARCAATDVFAVQDEITRVVVGPLKLKLLSGQTPTNSDRRPNLDAYNG